MRSLLALCAAACFAGAASTADLTGFWTGQLTGRNGEAQDITFKFQQEGAVLTGKMYLDSDDTPISDARITGDRISFSVSSDFNGTSVKLLFSGTVKDGGIELTREREGGGTNAKSGDRRNLKQTLMLKRLL